MPPTQSQLSRAGASIAQHGLLTRPAERAPSCKAESNGD
jgi:hypothetical protein